MKIKITEGCVCYSETIDNKDISAYDEEVLKEVLKKCCVKISRMNNTNLPDKSHLRELIWTIAHEIPDAYEYSEPCECCGDVVETYVFEV